MADFSEGAKVEFDDFNLDEFLEEHTIERSSHSEPAQKVTTSFSGIEFEESDNSDFEEFEDEKKVDSLVPYDPVEAANNLVSLLTSANHLITPLARWKLQEKRGGKKKIQILQNSFSKQVSGQELTELDKLRINMYTSYLKDKEELENAIPFTDEEFKTLVNQAIPYCRATRINIGGGASFWTSYGIMQAQRVFSILQA